MENISQFSPWFLVKLPNRITVSMYCKSVIRRLLDTFKAIWYIFKSVHGIQIKSEGEALNMCDNGAFTASCSSPPPPCQGQVRGKDSDYDAASRKSGISEADAGCPGWFCVFMLQKNCHLHSGVSPHSWYFATCVLENFPCRWADSAAILLLQQALATQQAGDYESTYGTTQQGKTWQNITNEGTPTIVVLWHVDKMFLTPRVLDHRVISEIKVTNLKIISWYALRKK